MRSRGNGSLRWRKSIFEAPLIFFLIFREYIGARSRSGGAREATSLPTAASPLVAEWGLVGSLEPTWLGPKAPGLLPFGENHFGVFLPFGLRSKIRYEKSLKHGKKQELTLDTELIS